MIITMQCKCGRTITGESGEIVICECENQTMLRPPGYKPPDPQAIREARRKRQQRLGDWTEQQLKSIGITPERYAAAKELFGLAPTCGCEKRKQWLNSVSDWWRGQPADSDA